ncbi:MAG: hypothetical protein NZ990_01160 [Myxococcota bacterium]|nr:hypothetical protein [Myxococcota bacterium]
MSEDGSKNSHWLERPGSVDKIIRTLAVICALLVVADFFYEKHGHYSWENFPGFYAFFGFVSCVGLVLAAKLLRRILKRDEDYYD